LSFDTDKFEKELSYIVHYFEGKLHHVGVDTVADLIRNNERQIAIEILCDLLCEDYVPLESDIYRRIVKAGESLHVDRSYFENIKSLIIKDHG
jgi:hypothetical protein